ncbi:MAG: helix-turn-helix domain-containing protein [Lentisphaerae bacterium]|nr:helix-turn-helix domain-containing protein [Lentisphaerota bacterium]
MPKWWDKPKETGKIRKRWKRSKVVQVAVDTSGNQIEVFTVKQAAKYLGITKSELKLQLFKKKYLTYYKVFTRGGSKVVRIKKSDLEHFKLDTKMFDRIADRIKQARLEHRYVATGLPQADLSRKSKVQREHINRIECKKVRCGIPALKKIGRVLGKPMEYFLD